MGWVLVLSTMAIMCNDFTISPLLQVVAPLIGWVLQPPQLVIVIFDISIIIGNVYFYSFLIIITVNIISLPAIVVKSMTMILK